MKEVDLFKKSIPFLDPYNIEFLWDIAQSIGYSNEYDNPKVKKETLEVLIIMLDLKILNIKYWLTKPELENKNLSSNEIIQEIDKMWVKGTNYPDFYDMVMFDLPLWYKEGLEALGLSEIPTKEVPSWKYFVENKIENLEQWIIENKPK